MKFRLSVILIMVTAYYSCGPASSSTVADLYDLSDTIHYKLSETIQGQGGVYFKTEIYTHERDTALSYVKVFNYDQQLAAVQFYKSNLKDGPTITFGDKAQRQQGTYYRNDTAIDMRSFNK